ncbi:cobaltochelatase subunit CobN [Litoribrevibacter euphylliae]|uniref:Cobaltochelatase subunit CobN n=1 Tax=Litoribrevibacter euphylliae TaxID=1834034 RepID=A0ABV7HF18_9GAMM
MHLFAAQPGGFNDEEGIVDLQQSPADLVILSAADSTLAALANTAESLPDDYPSLRLANWMNLTKPAALDLYIDKVIDHAKVVIVSVLGGENYWPYGVEQLIEWANGGRDRVLVLVPGDDAQDESLMRQSTVDYGVVFQIWRYLREGGAVNFQQFYRYLKAELFSGTTDCEVAQWQAPRPLPHCLLYAPAYLDLKGEQINGVRVNTYSDPIDSRSLVPEKSQATYQDWQQHWLQNDPLNHKPVAVLLFYRSHLQSANTAMFDQLIALLSEQGLNPLPVAISSLKDNESLALVNALIEQSKASVIINTTGFASNRVESPDLSSQPTVFQSPFDADIPVLQLVLSSSTEDDWQAYSQGLRSRDIAMQVVLPEMDGRVITRAVSFKSEAWYSERCQISVVGYQLHHERALFVARLAKAYGDLASKPNHQKRIAVILANYPTKDGRIGNGVGLDTPASTIHILKALEEAGYPIQNVPETGNALIEELLGAVTNNPNTLHQLPCWQSISAEDYWRYFCELPEACQQAVLDRWGTPDHDPKYRNGRLMLSGIRLGETFVGIQPARGYNLDLAANYHDPDLIPPHSYLAFYFWLRHCYQVSAVIHVGKHGNLEWLPGKGSALSDQCWPDIALGPMPHFYPFIVNDPGEGSQAKRRTQAVIIDHLMPPMTRAESYGELAELEGLVDEYYQALGMDTRREQWLKDEILIAVRASNLLQELAVKDQSDNEQVLEQLDAYLCEIKEAQIRHGLHILGELPNQDKLADTLVALLRLPRGSEAHSQGILHNLIDDLNLLVDGELFDPLMATVEPWQGNRPECLAKVSGQIWRTEQDTRERLELLSKSLVEDYVLSDVYLHNDELPETLSVQFPKTTLQLIYAKMVVLKALNQSVEQEISALVKGLAGQFVEPGPSGAPTRGRLDTLPTGRNFFSVDNRSIPSPAAWAIGQRSAQALIERHLQEHGDYPKQLGLSVWGTATMRTGGDDIAQAFALMGIKPIWADGSHRVIDFEIVPGMLLGRPRVDVTLRVSGFFRDAFPNVMRIYDAAVLALAEYDEPGTDNVIQQNIRQRQQTLMDQGLSPEEAKRQASYRVFGSKPGAYGAGLQGLIDERCWETRADLAEAYLNWGGYAYGTSEESRDGADARGAFQHRLSQLEAVVQNQDNREHDLLDSDDYYQFQGGMTNAVAEFSGQEPVVYHNDHSNPMAPKVRTLKEELNRVIRSRVLNPKWIEAMREHGYKGAFEMSASVDYLFAYDATTNLIDDYQYQYVADALVFDEENKAFMEQNNPHALEEMAERLLEATQRGLWQEPGDYADKLQDLLLEIDQQQEGM